MPQPNPPNPQQQPAWVVSKKDCFWRAMRNASGDPVFEQKFDGPAPSTWQEVYDTFKRYFAGKVPAATSPKHAQGEPEVMDYGQIVQELQAQEGAEGVVIVVYTNNESHAFNAANFKRNVVFIDDQKQFWPGNAPTQTVEAALRGKVAYSMFYRTR